MRTFMPASPLARAMRHVLHASAQRLQFRLDNVIGRWIQSGADAADATVDCHRRLAILDERLEHEPVDPFQHIDNTRLHAGRAWYLAAAHALAPGADDDYRLESVCLHAGMAIGLTAVTQEALARRDRAELTAAVLETADATSTSLIKAARALTGSACH